jgi:hypothetical protein
MSGVGAVMQGAGQILGSILNFVNQRAQLRGQQSAFNTISGNLPLQEQIFLSLLDPARANALGQYDIGTGLGIGTAEDPGILLRMMEQLGVDRNKIEEMYAGLGVNPNQAQWLDPLGAWAGNAQARGENLAGNADAASNTNSQLRDFFTNLMQGGIPTAGRDVGTSMIEGHGADANGNLIGRIAQSIIGSGGQSPELSEILKITSALMGTGGRTGNLDAASNAALNLISGQDPYSQQALQSASQILGTGGSTPTSQAAMQTALKLLNGGGSPEADSTLQLAKERYAANPLMSTNDALGAMQSQIGSQALKRASEANRQAYLRGGGPGATLASGTQEQARRDASASGLEAEALALSQFLQGREKLGLDQQNSAAGVIGNLINDLTQTKGIGASLASGLEGANTSRYGTGGNLLTSIINAQTNRAGTGFSGLNSTENTILGRLGLGVNSGLTGTGQASGNVQNALSQLGGVRQQDLANILGGSTLTGDFFKNLFGAAAGQNATVGNDTTLGNMGLNFQQLAQSIMGQGLTGTNSSLNQNQNVIQGFLDRIAGNTASGTQMGQNFLNWAQGGQNTLGTLAGSQGNNWTNNITALGRVFGG